MSLANRVLASVLGRLRASNVVMFHIGRSGSTVLADLLRQHPGVFWDGEIYERRFQAIEQGRTRVRAEELRFDPTQVLRRRVLRAGRAVYGFEVKFFHLDLAGATLPDYLESLDELGFTHFVVLERRNYLRKIVSSVIAHQQGRFHVQNADRTQPTRVVVDVDDVRIDRSARPLLDFLGDYHRRFRELDHLLAGRRRLWLTYEDDVGTDPRVGYRRVCEFLGLAPQPVEVRYGRTNPFALGDLVENLGTLRKTLEGTPFAWMLDA